MYISSKFKCQLSFNWHLNLIEDCATQSRYFVGGRLTRYLVGGGGRLTRYLVGGGGRLTIYLVGGGGQTDQIFCWGRGQTDQIFCWGRGQTDQIFCWGRGQTDQILSWEWTGNTDNDFDLDPLLTKQKQMVNIQCSYNCLLVLELVYIRIFSS